MELLNEIRLFERTGKVASKCFMEATLLHDLFEDMLSEDNNINDPRRLDVLSKINNNNYIKNNYAAFSEELKRNKRSEFLTPYTPEELKELHITTYQVPGYEIGFGLKPLPEGHVDIIGVHNNTDIKGIGEALVDSAIRLGGTDLDHYDGFLSDFYAKKGFNSYARMEWNDAYAPKNWDYEKYGRPPVIMRSLFAKK